MLNNRLSVVLLTWKRHLVTSTVKQVKQGRLLFSFYINDIVSPYVSGIVVLISVKEISVFSCIMQMMVFV